VFPRSARTATPIVVKMNLTQGRHHAVVIVAVAGPATATTVAVVAAALAVFVANTDNYWNLVKGIPALWSLFASW